MTSLPLYCKGWTRGGGCGILDLSNDFFKTDWLIIGLLILSIDSDEHSSQESVQISICTPATDIGGCKGASGDDFLQEDRHSCLYIKNHYIPP